MAEYYPHEERPDGDWVLAFFPQAFETTQTINVRLFPTYEKAENFYGVKGAKGCYLEAADLGRKLGGESMLKWYRHLNALPPAKTSVFADRPETPHFEDLPDEAAFNRQTVALRLWELCQAVGDRVRGANISVELDEDLFVIRLDRLTVEREKVERFVRQKRIICEALLELNKSKCDELELQAMMRTLVASGKLKTKQDPWRIFRYYAPELGDEGFLYYPTKRHKREDHEQNL